MIIIIYILIINQPNKSISPEFHSKDLHQLEQSKQYGELAQSSSGRGSETGGEANRHTPVG